MEIHRRECACWECIARLQLEIMASMYKRISRMELVRRRLRSNNPKRVYCELLSVAKTKGYKDGWIAHKFKELFGAWPKAQSECVPCDPSSDLLTHLAHQKRAYGLRKAREDKKKAGEVPNERATKRDAFSPTGAT